MSSIYDQINDKLNQLNTDISNIFDLSFAYGFRTLNTTILQNANIDISNLSILDPKLDDISNNYYQINDSLYNIGQNVFDLENNINNLSNNIPLAYYQMDGPMNWFTNKQYTNRILTITDISKQKKSFGLDNSSNTILFTGDTSYNLFIGTYSNNKFLFDNSGTLVLLDSSGGIKYPGGEIQTSATSGGSSPWTSVSGGSITTNKFVSINTIDSSYSLNVGGTVNITGSLYQNGQLFESGFTGVDFVGSTSNSNTTNIDTTNGLLFMRQNHYKLPSTNIPNGTIKHLVHDISYQQIHTMNNGVNNVVYDVAVDNSNNIIACGSFTTAGTVSSNYIAKWTPDIGWAPLGTGLNGLARAVCVDNSNNIYVGGDFTIAGGISMARIAKWTQDTSSWSTMGTGSLGSIYSMIKDYSNNMYVSGNFTRINDVSASYIARYSFTDSTFYRLDKGLTGFVESMAIDASKNLVVAGDFSRVNGSDISANYVGRWNGSTWSGLGVGINNIARNVGVDNSNNIYIAGLFTTGGTTGKTLNYVSRRDPLANDWFPLYAGFTQGLTTPSGIICLDLSGNLFLGGGFTRVNDISCAYFARYNPGSDLWTNENDLAFNNSIRVVKTDLCNNLIIGGQFTSLNQAGTTYTANRIMRYSLNSLITVTSDNNIYNEELFNGKALIFNRLGAEAQLVWDNSTNGWYVFGKRNIRTI